MGFYIPLIFYYSFNSSQGRYTLQKATRKGCHTGYIVLPHVFVPFPVAQPINDLCDRVDTLADSGISDISVKGDVIRFASDRDSPGMACISIPYQAGWNATIDGENAEVVCIQDGLCGLYVDAGHHEIVMDYNTPYLSLSWCSFGLGLIMLFWRLIAEARRNRNHSITICLASPPQL